MSQSGDTEVLDRFRNSVGVGKVYGPYFKGHTRKPVYEYYAHGPDAGEVYRLIGSYVSSIKEKQMLETMAKRGITYEKVLEKRQ